MQKPACKAGPAFRLPEQVDATIRTPDDAVARQYLPDARENIILSEEDADPIGDNAHSPVKGLSKAQWAQLDSLTLAGA